MDQSELCYIVSNCRASCTDFV